MAIRQSAAGNGLDGSTTIVSYYPLTVCMWICMRASQNYNVFFYIYLADDYAHSLVLQTSWGPNIDVLHMYSGGNYTPLFTMIPDNWYFVGFRTVPERWDPNVAFYSPAGGGSITYVDTTDCEAFSNGILSLLYNQIDFEWANGSIENVKIWNATLTNAEIEAEQWSHSPKRVADLILSAPLLNTNDIKNYAGTSLNLTKAGSNTTESGPAIGWPNGLIFSSS
jgi:hypothetical protein